MRSKGQSAMEYMQTYGWAILVIMVIGITLWQYGVFSRAPQENRAIGFSKIQVLEPSIRYKTPDPAVCATVLPLEKIENHLNFTLINTQGNYIHIESIALSEDCREEITIPGATCTNTQLSTDTLSPDETAHITHSCCLICSKIAPGDFFYVNMTIVYWERIGDIKTYHTEKGVIQGFAEPES